MCEAQDPPALGSALYMYWHTSPIPVPGSEVTIHWGIPLRCRVDTAHASSGATERRKLSLIVLAHLDP